MTSFTVKIPRELVIMVVDGSPCREQSHKGVQVGGRGCIEPRRYHFKNTKISFFNQYISWITSVLESIIQDIEIQNGQGRIFCDIW